MDSATLLELWQKSSLILLELREGASTQCGVWERFLGEITPKLNLTGGMKVWEEGKGNSRVTNSLEARGSMMCSGKWKAMVLIGRDGAEFVGRNHIMMGLYALPGTLDLILKAAGGPVVRFRFMHICIILFGF